MAENEAIEPNEEKKESTAHETAEQALKLAAKKQEAEESKESPPVFDLKAIQEKLYIITRSKIFLISFLVLSVFVITASVFLVYATYKEETDYPQLNQTQSQELESAMLEAIEYYKDEPKKTIGVLENFAALPKLYENRKNFLLSDFYERVGETALAFIKAYEISDDYLPQYARFRRVQLAQKIGLEATVVQDLNFLTKNYPSQPKFVYELAKSYARQSLFDDATKTFAIVQESFPGSEYDLGADYYLANLSSDKEEQQKRLSRYLVNAANGGLSALVVQSILSKPPEDQASYSKLTNYIGLAHYYSENYQEALKFFNFDFDKPDLYIIEYAKSLLESKKKSAAVNFLMKFLPKLEDEKKAIAAIDLLCDLGSKYTDIAHLKVLNPQMKIAQSKIAWELARRTKSKSDYTKVFQEFPDSKYAGESLARVFWKEYLRKNYHRALELAKMHWLEYTDTSSHPMVAFWAGKIHIKMAPKPEDSYEANSEEQKKLDQREEFSLDDAFEIYNNLILAHPKSYYSFRAQQIIDKKSDWYKLPDANEFMSFPDWDWQPPYSDKELKQKFGADVLELSKIAQYDFLLKQMQNKQLEPDKNLEMWLYAKSGNALKAISTAYFSLPKNQDIDKQSIKYQYAYPLAYGDLIADEIGSNLKIDPMIAHSLVRQESRYQTAIRSKVGAVGLMQLMPYTARSLARSLKMPIPSKGDLTNPEINVKLGIKYMEKVFAKFDNNMIFAIASYNAGPVVVKQWKRRYKNFDADEIVERIPYDETRNYVKKVLNNYWIYRELYS